MAKWPDTSVYTPIKNINKGNEYQEADGLTAADMNAIVENIDYLYNNSSPDIDTLANIIKGGTGIAVAKDTSEQNLKIEIDPSNAGWLSTLLGARVGMASLNDSYHICFYLNPNPVIEWKTTTGGKALTTYYKFPEVYTGTKTLLTHDYVKTINGNSIVGSGDITISGGTVDADTLNGLLRAGEGISIGKTTAGNKVEVKLDPSSIPVFTGISAADNSYQTTIYSDNIQVTNNEGTTRTYVFPEKDESFYIILTDANVKTLFGNKSIVGSGNIDLYQHHILCSTPNAGIKVLITVISSNNLKIDSLTDLKTLLGNTFECPCIGYAMAQNQSLAICNENGFLPIDIWINVADPTPDVTWSDIESIVDTVTTI